MSNRATHERLIARSSSSLVRSFVADMLRTGGASMLNDEAVERLARDLATHERLRARIDRENRDLTAQSAIQNNTSEAA